MSEQAERRNETEDERRDRNLADLMQELRVAFPGVQILFAFLLVVPFQSGWPQVTETQKVVYFVTLLLTAITAVLLISPSAYHRITFRMQQKDRLVTLANRFAIAGIGTLALAMTGAIVLITDVLYGATATAVTGALALLTFASFWYLLPLKRRLSSEEEPDPPTDSR